MLKKEFHDRVLKEFPTKTPVKVLAKELGIHYIQIRDFWNERFGAEATKYRGRISPTQFEALKTRMREEFKTSLGMKNLAKEVNLSPKRLRDFWISEFGEEAFKARADRINVETGKTVGHAKKGCTYELKTVKDVCDTCGKTYEKNQFSRATICPTCIEIRDMHTVKSGEIKSTSCPVCGELFGGNMGLAAHFRHQGEDPAHKEYLEIEEEKKWRGKIENEDYIVCKICDQKFETLANHLVPVHEISAVIYRRKFKGALIRCENLRKRRSESYYKWVASNPTKGLTKIVKCKGCKKDFMAPKTLAYSTHVVLCLACKEKKAELERIEYDKQWVGKSEPEDYVTCQLCGHKSVNLCSHIQSVHSEQMMSYTGRFADHEIMALCCGARDKEHWAKNYTKEQLLKYADEKGHVIVIDAEVGLGCSWMTIHRYCKQHGLKTRNLLAFQKSVLEAVKQVLLGAEYEWEHRDPSIRSLKNSKYLLSFDGYFPDYNLIVEAHGRQHFERIPYFHKYDGDFEYGQRLDQHKRESAIELGYTYLEVRYDEPYTDLRHIRTRLRDLQVEIVAKSDRSRNDAGVVSDRNQSEEEEMDFEDLVGNQ